MPGTIFKYAFLMLLLSNMLCGSFAQEGYNSSSFKQAKKLNDSEKRLIRYKDSDSDLLLKLNQLKVINKSRSRHNAPPVSLDILASRVANKACMEAANGKYVSHWNMRGESPYHRYAFAGGTDHVSENTSGESFSGSYIISDRTKAEMMISLHNSFMDEKPPANGHKLNVIDKNHNFVGIGFYLDTHEFRYNEEFIDRYIEVIGLNGKPTGGKDITIEVRPEKGFFICFLTAYYEKGLNPMSYKELRRTGSYSDFTDDIAFEIGPWDLAEFRSGGTYSIPLRFAKPGYYYIQIFIDSKEYLVKEKFTTKGKIQASGLVVKIE